MDVQRAKKCKLWSEGDQQLQSTTGPCPLLQPFCHQVSFCLFVFLKYKTDFDFVIRLVAILNSCNWMSRLFVSL